MFNQGGGGGNGNFTPNQYDQTGAHGNAHHVPQPNAQQFYAPFYRPQFFISPQMQNQHAYMQPHMGPPPQAFHTQQTHFRYSHMQTPPYIISVPTAAPTSFMAPQRFASLNVVPTAISTPASQPPYLRPPGPVNTAKERKIIKKRSHALAVINPITNKDVLDEMFDDYNANKIDQKNGAQNDQTSSDEKTIEADNVLQSNRPEQIAAVDQQMQTMYIDNEQIKSEECNQSVENQTVVFSEEDLKVSTTDQTLNESSNDVVNAPTEQTAQILSASLLQTQGEEATHSTGTLHCIAEILIEKNVNAIGIHDEEPTNSEPVIGTFSNEHLQRPIESFSSNTNPRSSLEQKEPTIQLSKTNLRKLKGANKNKKKNNNNRNSIKDLNISEESSKDKNQYECANADNVISTASPQEVLDEQCKKESSLNAETYPNVSTTTVDEENAKFSAVDRTKYRYNIKQLRDLQFNDLSSMKPQVSKTCEHLMKNLRSSTIDRDHSSGKKLVNNFDNNYNKKLQSNSKRQNMPTSSLPTNQSDMIHIRLSLQDNISLNETENAWKPSVLRAENCKSVDSGDVTDMTKKIRGLLNRLTPENFDNLVKIAAQFKIDTPEKIESVMILLFEKAVSEPNFAPIYARFCKIIFIEKQSGRDVNFLTVLLNHTESEFTQNVNNAEAKKLALKPIIDRLLKCSNDLEKAEIQAELEEKEYLFRRRAWGTVRFIGELFNLHILTGNIIMRCVKALLDPSCEEKVEYLCKLLTTVGSKLEHSHKIDLDNVFVRIRDIVSKKRGSTVKLSNRVRFMLQDVVDLRNQKWNPNLDKAANNVSRCAPVEDEHYGRNQNKRHQRNKMRFTKNQDYSHERKNTIQTVDRSKLFPILQSGNDSPKKLGNFTQFVWGKTNPSNIADTPTHKISIPKTTDYINNQPIGSVKESKTHQPTPSSPPPKTDPSSTECEDILNNLIDSVMRKHYMECVKIWSQVDKSHHAFIVFYLFSEYFFLESVKSLERHLCSEAFSILIKHDAISMQNFKSGYLEFCNNVEEILIDVPDAWTHIFEFVGPLVMQNTVDFSLIWNKHWFDKTVGLKFLRSFIVYVTGEFGPNSLIKFWKRNNIRFDKFMKSSEVNAFIRSNKLEFVQNSDVQAPVFVSKDIDDVVQRMSRMMKEDKSIDLIFDYVGGNIPSITKEFIRSLTKMICDYCVIYSNNSISIKKLIFKDKCTHILRRYIDSNGPFEIECLMAIEGFFSDLGPSKDLITMLLNELLETDLISMDAFAKWKVERESNATLDDELKSFFRNLFN